MASRGLIVVVTALALVLAARSADTREAWQLSEGPFTTAADVTAHNGLHRDIADIEAALATSPPSWGEALAIYTFGRHFPWRDRTHSLGRFADDYNGRMAAVLPQSVAVYGDPAFLNDLGFSALAGTGRFQSADDDTRRAAMSAIMRSIALSWCRFEIAEADRKARAAEPNWSLENGAPKNWNEIFAFYWAEPGLPSLYASLQAHEAGREVNASLLAALSEGQAALLERQWPEAAASAVRRALDAASVLLLDEAAVAMHASLDDPTAWAALGGAFAGAAEPVTRADAAAAARYVQALRGKPDAALAADISELLAKVRLAAVE